MYKYFRPEQVLAEYHTRFGVSLHNHDSHLANAFAQKVFNGRTLIADYFGLQASEISFQPAAFWAWKLLLQTLDHDSDLVVYATNLHQLTLFHPITAVSNNRYHNLLLAEYLAEPENFITQLVDQKATRLAIVINEITDPNIIYDQLAKFLVQITQKLSIKPVILIDLSLFFYQDLTLISPLIDGFVFNPYYAFNITGVVVLGIKTKYHNQIPPVILGGGAVLSLSEQSYQTPPYPQGVEAGTNNYPKILLLINYFKYYLDHQQLIDQELTRWIVAKQLVRAGLRFTYYAHDQLLICNYNLENI